MLTILLSLIVILAMLGIILGAAVGVIYKHMQNNDEK